MNKTTVIGLDLAKHSFEVVVINGQGQLQQRKSLRRHTLLPFLLRQAPAVVAMEACASAHHWARRIGDQGHQVRLLPPQHVKGYLRGQKNDYNDALAIAEACVHGRVRPVPVKTLAQQDEQCLHAIRRGLNADKVRLSNQLRGLLGEYGLVVPRGDAALRRALVTHLDETATGLSPRVRTYLARQYARFVALLDELAWYDADLRQRVKQDEACIRLQAIPGIGPVVASMVRHWMGDGRQFTCGRDASAALGLVPRQHSTGGRQRLGGISKRGDPHVRSVVVHGARAVVSRASGKTDPLSCWVQQLRARRGFNKAVVALANKIIRMAWVVIARGEHYRPQGEVSSVAA
ncbi:IS110 family transposase [Parahaliea mediterranea]|uniref:IS110 family transposase n=1 Tax=Parahaliea mediterranea TaxID=651086 RepID=A0A939DIY5_9GAMM|nr:IS110 family transposase [Parahaliea mediterranea]MBN7799205.1 IS110 family transposase [Parahaliea mediterranea]